MVVANLMFYLSIGLERRKVTKPLSWSASHLAENKTMDCCKTNTNADNLTAVLGEFFVDPRQTFEAL
jgi:hypothetical protein